MHIRQKKLIGTVVFITGSAFYFFVAITIAIARLPGTPIGVHLLYYLFITLVWVFFAALLIRWMQKPGSERAV